MNRQILKALMIAVVLAAAGTAAAGTVSVSQGRCGDAVTLQAENARLSEVFSALADEMGFALRFTRDSDRKVDFDLTRAPQDLIDSLTREDNVIVTTAPDDACVAGTRITAVRFLAAGKAIVIPAHKPTDAAPMKQVSEEKKASSKASARHPSQGARRFMSDEARLKDKQLRRAQRKR